METKAKKFSKKLLALLMAVVLGLTCFTGVLTSYAASSDIDYYDDALEHNTLGWAMLSDEQVATALLDYADTMLPALKEMEKTLAAQVDGMTVSGIIKLSWDINTRHLVVKALGITLADVAIKLGSVDELIETINSVNAVLEGNLPGLAASVGVDLGDIPSIKLSAFKGMSRATTSSCDIVRAVFRLLYDNREPIVGKLLRGTLTLGVLDGSFNIYNTLGDLVGTESGYQSNMVYNIVKSLILNKTGWFTAEEIEAYNNGTETFVLDEVLLSKLTSVVVQNMASVLVTYPDGSTSATRYAEIKAKMAEGMNYTAAASSLGYNPNLVYSKEFVNDNGEYQNILLFAYGSPDANGLPTENTTMLSVGTNDSILDIGFNALKIAWDSVLKDSVKLIHVNNFNDKGHGTNFDNGFYYWLSANGGWNTTDTAANYTAANVENWAAAVYQDYDAASAEEFLANVKDSYVFDREVAADAKGTWEDIDSTTLFNRVRYSPLADLYFDMQTGPLNLYLSQLGTPNLDKFFETEIGSYSNLISIINDALVAVVDDLFPNSKNIDAEYPVLTKTELGTPEDVVNNLVPNALAVLQYTADATDKNILNGFYKGGGTELTAINLEEAMIPFLISCIGNIWINSQGTLGDAIHPEDWDKCKDAEAVAFVALREYLSYVQAQKNYDDLAPVVDGAYQATLEGTIYPMARDAVAYVIQSLVPVTTKDGAVWTVEESTPTDGMDIFEILNSVVCYYAGRYELKTGYTNGVGNLLGAVNADGTDSVTRDNTLWENIDVIVNKFFPIMATFQGTASFDSEQFILNDIVKGILDVGDTALHGGRDGISNFLLNLLNGCAMAPIAETPVHLSVYDVLKDLLNGIFGARYTNQSFTTLVPDASSNHPFDDLLQVGVIAAENTGVVQKFLCNVPEFAGVAGYPDSVLPGLTYILNVVNGFFEFIPNIAAGHSNPVSGSVDEPGFSGMRQGESRSTNIRVKNNNNGLNTIYRDGVTKDVEWLTRYYYINLKQLKVNDSTDLSGQGLNVSGSYGMVNPGETLVLPITVTNTQGVDYTNKYTFVYDITDKNGNAISDEYKNLELNIYQFIGSELGWRETVYGGEMVDGMRTFASQLLTMDANKTLTYSGYTTKSTGGIDKGGRVNVLYPTQMVITSDNYADIDTYSYSLNNPNDIFNNNSGAIDGIYSYDVKTVHDDATNSDVSVDKENAIPVFDKNTGDIINYKLYDVKRKDTGAWDRNGYAGYTQAEVDAMSDITDIRTHIAYTFDEALQNGMIKAYDYDETNKLYNYIYLQNGASNTDFNYDKVLHNASMRGPVDGFVLNSQQVTVADADRVWLQMMYYDGSTVVEPGKYEFNLRCYATNGKAETDTIEFTVINTDGKVALANNYQSALDTVAKYQPEDFNDGGTAIAQVNQALQDALKVYGRAVKPDSAAALSDNIYLAGVTSQVASIYGDEAYVPYSTSNSANMPAIIKSEATVGQNGVYYYDAACTMPIYSNQKLTEADVTNGKDAAGVDVIADDNGKYYLKNTPVYETEWDTTTYSAPWRRPTDVQAKDSSGQLLYTRTEFNYYDINSASSYSDWVAKYAQPTYAVVANTGEAGSTDNRGDYTKTSDNLAYYLENAAEKSIDFGQVLFDEISMERIVLNENNFEITSYRQTMNAASDAESKYRINVTYAIDNEFGEKEVITVEGISFSNYYSNYSQYAEDTYKYSSETVVAPETELTAMQTQELIDKFDLLAGKMKERGYVGNKLEAEIKCASGNEYSKLIATKAVYGEDGSIVTPANIAKGAGAADPAYGSWDANGNLVNLVDGKQAYSDASWSAYVTALADAVALADYGNNEYAHNASTYYDMADKNGYDAQLTHAYTTETVLQMRENALAPVETASVLLTVADVEGAAVTVNGAEYTAPVAVEVGSTVTLQVNAAEGYAFDHMLVNGEKITENPYTFTVQEGSGDIAVQPVMKAAGITVSGTIKIATSVDGVSSTSGIVGINVIANGQVVATSAADGTFTATVPAGTTELTISGDTTIDRTVTLSGTADVTGAEIPVVICDYNKDGKINATDKGTFSISFSGAYNVYCDLNGDAKVNATDKGTFSSLFNKTVSYVPITLA